jgi:hypothetical protein
MITRRPARDYNGFAMVKKLREHAGDLRGVNRLVIDGIVGVVDLVEAMHYNIARVPGLIAKPTQDRTTGITGLVYRSVRGVIGLVGHGLDWLLARWRGSSPCSASEASGLDVGRCSPR